MLILERKDDLGKLEEWRCCSLNNSVSMMEGLQPLSITVNLRYLISESSEWESDKSLIFNWLFLCLKIPSLYFISTNKTNIDLLNFYFK